MYGANKGIYSLEMSKFSIGRVFTALNIMRGLINIYRDKKAYKIVNLLMHDSHFTGR